MILAYKMNGDWLAPKRGGPVRLVVPDGYGFKSIKWLQRVLLTNNPDPNDTYAGQNNDVDSSMKTFARFLNTPAKLKVGQPAALTGVAQVGMSGLSKIQYCLRPVGQAEAVRKRGQAPSNVHDGEGPAHNAREPVPVSEPVRIAGRPLSNAGQLAGCPSPAAAGALGWRLARRPATARPAPVRRPGTAADVALALRHRPLGGTADADGRGTAGVVLPHDRRTWHRAALAPPTAQIRPQRNPAPFG